MNLRVDLILETEKRSASVINAKSVLRISYIILPVILFLIIGGFVLSVWQLNSNLKTLEDGLAIDGPKKDKALKLRAEFQENLVILEEVKGWQKSHLSFYEQLVGVQKEVPEKIQLQNLTINHTVILTNNAPARVFTLSLSGKAFGDGAQSYVTQLENRLQKGPAFTNAMESAKVVLFKQPDNAADGNKSDRLFQIECAYKPRVLQ
jgi:hypothetical protein